MLKLKYSLCATLTLLISACSSIQPPPSFVPLSPQKCETIQPFSGCSVSIIPSAQTCKALAERNTPAFVFNQSSAPICLGPAEVLKPLGQSKNCQVFDQNNNASQCDNQLLMNCLKDGYFPPPVWPVAPEKFGENTNPLFRTTFASNAEVCMWYNHGQGNWPHAGVNRP